MIMINSTMIMIILFFFNQMLNPQYLTASRQFLVLDSKVLKLLNWFNLEKYSLKCQNSNMLDITKFYGCRQKSLVWTVAQILLKIQHLKLLLYFSFKCCWWWVRNVFVKSWIELFVKTNKYNKTLHSSSSHCILYYNTTIDSVVEGIICRNCFYSELFDAWQIVYNWFVRTDDTPVLSYRWAVSCHHFR